MDMTSSLKAHRERRVIGGFVGGVICTQFVNSAYHLAQPLLMAEMTGSIGHAAFFASFDTAIHMGGTFSGGWPVDRFGARRILIAATALRALALAAIPIALFCGSLTALWAMAWYTVDAFIRGFVDSAVFTLPMEFAENESERLDHFNSRYELAFDFGGIAGPLAFSALTFWFKGIVAHSLIPIGFAIAAVAYSSIPATASRRTTAANRAANGGTLAGMKAILANRSLLTACLGYMSFNVYPLRKLLSAFFAREILQQTAAAGFLGSAFSAGGLVGSILYGRFRDFGISGSWIFLGAAGLVTLGVAWIPASLPIMAAMAFAFALTNTGARLTLIRMRQEHTPLAMAGGVTAVSRFMANSVSVVAKALVGAAFTLGGSPTVAFSLVAGLFGLIALAQTSFLGRSGKTQMVSNLG